MSRNITVTLILLTAVVVLTASAAGALIGMVVTNGEVQVDKATVSGNANLSEGSNVLTNANGSRIQLSNGSRASLAPNSAARIYTDHLVLEKGLGVVATQSYKLQAKGLEVMPAASQAQAQVTMMGAVVQVAALNGPVQVRNASGMLMAKIGAGKALDITPGAGPSTTSTVSGVLRQEGGKYMLTDRLTNVDAELRGDNLQKDLGQLVEASGAAKNSADRNSQIIEVAMLNRLSSEEMQSGGQTPTGTKPTGTQPTGTQPTGTQPTGTTPTKTKTGMSQGAKVGIGVAVAGGAAVAIGVAAGGGGSNSR